jgi:hypothetical protein
MLTKDMEQMKMMKPTFRQFLERFPEVDLPITLTEESHLEFSRRNPPLPQEMIHEFIHAIEESEFDEFTEFIPCVKLPKTDGFNAIVYWRAGLMNYEYTLATFTEKGQFIEKKVIAGTKIHDGLLVRSVATIEDDWLIYIVLGKSDPNEETFTAIDSRSLNMELLATGEIITV